MSSTDVIAGPAGADADARATDLGALLEDAFVHAPIGNGLVAQDGRILRANPAMSRITGYTQQELLERTVGSITHPDDVETDYARARDLFEGRIDAYQVEKRYIHKDGRAIWVRLSVTGIRSPDGTTGLAVGLVEDISQQKALERALREGLAERDAAIMREKMLRRELDHRVRNNLAGLVGLVRLYGRSNATREDVIAGVSGKVRAMQEVHELIGRMPGREMNLRELVSRMGGEFAGGPVGTGAGARAARFAAAGPDVLVPASQASALAMILQELFANSLKHGALGRGEGDVQLEWNESSRGDGASAFEVVWYESGPCGPPLEGQGGIGLRLIEGLARSELRGDAVFSFSASGYVCRVEGVLSRGRDGCTGAGVDIGGGV